MPCAILCPASDYLNFRSAFLDTNNIGSLLLAPCFNVTNCRSGRQKLHSTMWTLQQGRVFCRTVLWQKQRLRWIRWLSCDSQLYLSTNQNRYPIRVVCQLKLICHIVGNEAARLGRIQAYNHSKVYSISLLYVYIKSRCTGVRWSQSPAPKPTKEQCKIAGLSVSRKLAA